MQLLGSLEEHWRQPWLQLAKNVWPFTVTNVCPFVLLINAEHWVAEVQVWQKLWQAEHITTLEFTVFLKNPFAHEVQILILLGHCKQAGESAHKTQLPVLFIVYLYAQLVHIATLLGQFWQTFWLQI